MNNLFKPAAYVALVLSSALLALAPAVAQDHSQHKSGHENHTNHKNHTSMKAAKVSHSSSVYQVDAHWITHKGEHMTLADLQGQPVIVSMIYGSCTTACPVLVNDAKRLYTSLSDEAQKQVKLVMVSFDNSRDTPKALADYVKQYKLNSDRWVFLHGEDQDIRTLATVLGVRYRKRPDGDFDHSNLITVLDENGVIQHRVEGLGQPMDKAAKVVDKLIQQ
jgi:protein SCO1/2